LGVGVGRLATVPDVVCLALRRKGVGPDKATHVTGSEVELHGDPVSRQAIPQKGQLAMVILVLGGGEGDTDVTTPLVGMGYLDCLRKPFSGGKRCLRVQETHHGLTKGRETLGSVHLLLTEPLEDAVPSLATTAQDPGSTITVAEWDVGPALDGEGEGDVATHLVLLLPFLSPFFSYRPVEEVLEGRTQMSQLGLEKHATGKSRRSRHRVAQPSPGLLVRSGGGVLGEKERVEASLVHPQLSGSVLSQIVLEEAVLPVTATTPPLLVKQTERPAVPLGRILPVSQEEFGGGIIHLHGQHEGPLGHCEENRIS
jgi:hypothetical protein